MAPAGPDAPPAGLGPLRGLRRVLTRRPRLLRPRKRRMDPAAVNVSVKAPVKVETKPLTDILAGALARAGSQSTIHPLDTIKVKMQAGAYAAKKGAEGAAKGVAKGTSKFAKLVPPVGAMRNLRGKALATQIGGLYSGVAGAACGAGIAIGAYFAVYSAASNALVRACKDRPVNAATIAFLAGGIAAAGSSVVKVPLAVCIRSVQAGVYPNAVEACRQIVRSAGVRGLFTGFLPTMLEDVPDMAVKFAVYEVMREMHANTMQRPTNATEDLVIGGIAGSAAAASTTPLDVVKTRMMCTASTRPSLYTAAMSVVKEGKGARAFFSGIWPRAISNGINTAVFFCFFEAIRGAIKTHKENARLREAHHAGLRLDVDDSDLYIVQTLHRTEGVQPVGASLSASHSSIARRRKVKA